MKKTGLMKNSGTSRESRRSNQAGDNEDFAFNGQMGDGVNRASNRYAGNQWSGHSNDGRAVNMGLMPSQRKGNTSDAPREGGPSVTRDPKRLTIATAAQGGRINGGTHCEYPENPDKINVG